MKILGTILVVIVALPVLVLVGIALGPVMLLILALLGTALVLTTLVWLVASAWYHLTGRGRIPPVHP